MAAEHRQMAILPHAGTKHDCRSSEPNNASLNLENQLLCLRIDNFAAIRNEAIHDPELRSLIAQMWQARKHAMALRDRRLESLFRG